MSLSLTPFESLRPHSMGSMRRSTVAPASSHSSSDAKTAENKKPIVTFASLDRIFMFYGLKLSIKSIRTAIVNYTFLSICLGYNLFQAIHNFNIFLMTGRGEGASYCIFFTFTFLQILYFAIRKNELKLVMTDALFRCKSDQKAKVKKLCDLGFIIWSLALILISFFDFYTLFYYGFVEWIRIIYYGGAENVTINVSSYRYVLAVLDPSLFCLASSWYPFITLIYVVCMYCINLVKVDYLKKTSDLVEKTVSNHNMLSMKQIKDLRYNWNRISKLDKRILSFMSISLFFFVSYLFVMFSLMVTTLTKSESKGIVLIVSQMGIEVIQALCLPVIIIVNHHLNSQAETCKLTLITNLMEQEDTDVEILQEKQSLMDEIEFWCRKIQVFSVFELNLGLIFVMGNALIPLSVLIFQMSSPDCGE